LVSICRPILQSQWTVIVVASTRIVFEVFQMFMVRSKYYLNGVLWNIIWNVVKCEILVQHMTS
jgi:hypothetical protein